LSCFGKVSNAGTVQSTMQSETKTVSLHCRKTQNAQSLEVLGMHVSEFLRTDQVFANIWKPTPVQEHSHLNISAGSCVKSVSTCMEASKHANAECCLASRP
jgi:hypothetical protein